MSCIRVTLVENGIEYKVSAYTNEDRTKEWWINGRLVHIDTSKYINLFEIIPNTILKDIIRNMLKK